MCKQNDGTRLLDITDVENSTYTSGLISTGNVLERRSEAQALKRKKIEETSKVLK